MRLTRPYNINPLQRKAITSLRCNTSIVIKPADKGSSTVILNRSDYIAEAERQLHNPRDYQILQRDPTPDSATFISDFLHKMHQRKEINDHTLDYLLPLNPPRTPEFYLLPKIHKVNIPGRPILSANGCPTERISEFVDYFLQPIVQKSASYIKDTTHFLTIINEIKDLPPNSTLVCLDVTSLYTNIPQNEALDALTRALENNPDPTRPSTHALVQLTSYVLKLNFFRFNNTIYHQKHGTAMGTRCAPSLANIFMTDLENRIILNAPTDTRPLLWNRFIDDIFSIFTIPHSKILAFINFANQFHPTIKFTYEISQKSVHFLDTTIRLHPDNTLSSSLYIKPTDNFQYLHMDSCHPFHCKRSIPYSQAIRIRRICSNASDATHHLRKLFTRFLKRGYNKETLLTQFNRAISLPRDILLQPKSKSKPTNNRVPLVVTFDPSLPNLGKIVHNNFHLLSNDPTTAQIFTSPPLVSYRQPPNLRKLLTRAKLPTINKQIPPEKCNNINCLCCNYISLPPRIFSPSNHTTHTPDRNLKCTSRNLIYLIECTNCNLQYVGETGQQLNQRFTHHRSSIRLKKPTNVALHFNLPDHSNLPLRIIPLEQCQTFPSPLHTTSHRKHRERIWIFKLKSYSPFGLN